MGEDRPKSCNRTKGARRLQRRGNNLLIEQSPWQLVELGTALSLILNRAFVRSINRKEILRI